MRERGTVELEYRPRVAMLADRRDPLNTRNVRTIKTSRVASDPQKMHMLHLIPVTGIVTCLLLLLLKFRPTGHQARLHVSTDGRESDAGSPAGTRYSTPYCTRYTGQ